MRRRAAIVGGIGFGFFIDELGKFITVAPLRELLMRVDALPTPPPSRYSRVAARVRAFTHRVVERPRFPAALITVFGGWALLTFASAFELVLSIALNLGGAHPGFVTDNLAHLTFANVATLAASVVSAAFVAIAVRRERAGERLEACHWLERALLIAILVVQVLAFYESQFGAVFGLAVDLLLLAAVRQIAADARERGVGVGLPEPQSPAPAPAPA